MHHEEYPNGIECLLPCAQDDWSKAEQLLHWFKAGAEDDSFASLSFSRTLGQGARAAIHRQSPVPCGVKPPKDLITNKDACMV